MYAIFEDGSRQYRVKEGDLVQVDYREAVEGDTVEFKRVLLHQTESSLEIGRPVVVGARVVTEVVDHPSVKTYIQHFRRRKNSRRLKGHRQPFTQVRVKWILLAGQEPPAPPVKAESTPAAELPVTTPAAETPASTPPAAETPATPPEAPKAETAPEVPPTPPAPEAGTPPA